MAHLSLKLAISRVFISCWLKYLFAEVEGVLSERIEPKPEKKLDNKSEEDERRQDEHAGFAGNTGR